MGGQNTTRRGASTNRTIALHGFRCCAVRSTVAHVAEAVAHLDGELRLASGSRMAQAGAVSARGLNAGAWSHFGGRLSHLAHRHPQAPTQAVYAGDAHSLARTRAIAALGAKAAQRGPRHKSVLKGQ
jgi:hypothetical protein